MRTALITLAAAFGLSGCGLLYDIGQEKARENCDRAYSAQDREACRKANSQTYDDYERRRQAAKEGKAP